MQLVKPFLKWPGGKFRLLDRILYHLPQGERLIEPFVGSGAVFLNASFKEFCIYDSSPDLIGLFQVLQQEGEFFIKICQTFFTTQYNNANTYYTLRTIFNHSIHPFERAVLFLYLNRHSFNGLVRYNSMGLFNVPFGRYNNPYFPKKEMEAFLKKMKETSITFAVCDFRDAFKNLYPGDVVYCDPPYLPLSNTSNFTTYSGTVFSYDDQKDLANLAYKASEQGIPVVLSNHDTPVTRELYSMAKIDCFSVQRFISCNGKDRRAAPELMAIFT